MARFRRSALIASVALTASAFAAGSAVADRGATTSVCHVTPNGPVVLDLPTSAVSTHVGVHDGDGVVGTDVDADCATLPDTPPGTADVLARAVSTDSSGAEVLVAQLEDTSGDGTVSVGDTVVTAAYPLDLGGGAYATSTATSHVVDRVDRVSATEVRVQVGTASFEWDTDQDGTGDELYEERGAANTVLLDGRSAASAFDVVFVALGSPGEPDRDAVAGEESPVDDAFLDVSVTAGP